MGIIIEKGMHSLACFNVTQIIKIYMSWRMFGSAIMNFLLPFEDLIIEAIWVVRSVVTALIGFQVNVVGGGATAFCPPLALLNARIIQFREDRLTGENNAYFQGIQTTGKMRSLQLREKEWSSGPSRRNESIHKKWKREREENICWAIPNGEVTQSCQRPC